MKELILKTHIEDHREPGRTVCGRPISGEVCGGVEPKRMVGENPTCVICLHRHPVQMTLSERVSRWVVSKLGYNLLHNRKERATRLLEESLELAQAEGVSYEVGAKLLHRVYSRPVGDPAQEVAGVNVCLLAYAVASETDVTQATTVEIARMEGLDKDKLRVKHNAKAEAGVALYAGEELCEECGKELQGSNMCLACGHVSH